MDEDSCLIIAGGSPPPAIRIHALIQKEHPRIICADSGAVYAAKMDIRPDLICGDMDSIDTNTLKKFKEDGVNFDLYPKEKDETDTEIALKKALEWNVDHIYLCGIDGGRLDHLLANYMLAAYHANQAMITNLSFDHTVYFVTERHRNLELKGVFGQICSLIPLVDCSGVTLEGFRYPLNQAKLKFGTTLGSSNEIIAEKAKISLRNGLLIVVVEHIH